jgi:hypothetical protein
LRGTTAAGEGKVNESMDAFLERRQKKPGGDRLSFMEKKLRSKRKKRDHHKPLDISAEQPSLYEEDQRRGSLGSHDHYML